MKTRTGIKVRGNEEQTKRQKIEQCQFLYRRKCAYIYTYHYIQNRIVNEKKNKANERQKKKQIEQRNKSNLQLFS